MKYAMSPKRSVYCLLLASSLCVASLLRAAEPARPVYEPEWRTARIQTEQPASDDWAGQDGVAERLFLTGTDSDPLWYRLLHDKLEIGTRYTDYTLNTTAAPEGETFLGTINHLQDEQDHSPNKFFFRYFVIPWIGVEWTMDEVRARTITREDGHSDGVFVADGKYLTVVGRVTLEEILQVADWACHKGEWPTDGKYAWADRIRPYVGYGTGDFSIDFEADPWWRLGYPDRQTWVEDGSPTTRPAGEGRRRNIDADDASGDVMTFGCSVYLAKHVFVDAYWRQTSSLETTALYTLSSPPRREEAQFPLDNDAFGLGIGVGF